MYLTHYGSYRTVTSFDLPTQNTININSCYHTSIAPYKCSKDSNRMECLSTAVVNSQSLELLKESLYTYFDT